MQKIDRKFLRPRLEKRTDDSHKGDYGHLLLICGSRPMPGAALLSTGAALKSGCGLVTLHTTAIAAQATMASFPSAMLSIDPEECFSQVPEGMLRFAAVAVGPGLGVSEKTVEAFRALLGKAREVSLPLVVDADAINIIANHPELRRELPPGSVITPHEAELLRLLGGDPGQDREKAVSTLCRETGCVVIAKGFHTEIFTPEGEKYVNTTGNSGLAKGGSGDVLTGLVGGLLARGYSALNAALLGVWIHGYAGDCLTESCTAEAYNSRDLIDALYQGFKALL